MARSGPDLEGLRRFIRLSDREPTPFFVGRTAQIEDIEQQAAHMLRQAQAGLRPAGATRLAQGAPGAGKSALLAHLERKWAADAGAPLVLTAWLGQLADPDGMAIAIAECLDPQKAAALRRTETRSGGIAVAGLSGSWTRETAPAAGMEALRKLFPPEGWTRPLCLLVDEVQNLEAEQAGLLRRLHEGVDGLPVLPVLAGLANAQDVLARHGVSRLSHGAAHTLGRLAPGEPAESARLMLERFRVDMGEVAAAGWAARLERVSDGWPQHLHNAMRALAEGLLAVGGALGAVDADAVLGRARQWRLEAYRARRSGSMRRSALLLGALMEAVAEEGLGWPAALAAIEERADARPGWRLPDGMDPEAYLDHLVQRGALQDDGAGRLVCPIPSFRRFLIEEAKG